MRLYGLYPDAPVFFNLFPGIWTGAHPPQENTIPHAFQRSRKNVGQIYLFFYSFFGWPPLTSKFNPSINLFCNVFNKPITPCQLTPPRLPARLRRSDGYLFGQVNRFSYHLTFTLWNSFLHPLLVSSLTLFLCQTQIYVTLVQI